MSYNRPIHGTFAARAKLAQPAKWPQFLRLLTRRGVARITIASTLEFAGEEIGFFTGDFVAFGGH